MKFISRSSRTIIIVLLVLACNGLSLAQDQIVPRSKTPPNLPVNIPPPPSFGSSSSKNGRFQFLSAEYYSEDNKPFLYKRLIKVDTSTGEAWVLHSERSSAGETRTWVPLINRKS